MGSPLSEDEWLERVKSCSDLQEESAYERTADPNTAVLKPAVQFIKHSVEKQST
jgi:hypothetical protein